MMACSPEVFRWLGFEWMRVGEDVYGAMTGRGEKLRLVYDRSGTEVRARLVTRFVTVTGETSRTEPEALERLAVAGRLDWHVYSAAEAVQLVGART